MPKIPAKKATEQVPFGLKSVYRVRANSFIAPTDAERAASATFKARPMPTHQDMVCTFVVTNIIVNAKGHFFSIDDLYITFESLSP